MLGLREQDLPADIDGFWRRWDEIKAKLENNPVVQDVLHNGPKPPRSGCRSRSAGSTRSTGPR